MLRQWRDGSKRIKEMIKKLNELEINFNKQHNSVEDSRKLINGYGEATDRHITTITYDTQQKRLSKEILSFMGRR